MSAQCHFLFHCIELSVWFVSPDCQMKQFVQDPFSEIEEFPSVHQIILPPAPVAEGCQFVYVFIGVFLPIAMEESFITFEDAVSGIEVHKSFVSFQGMSGIVAVIVFDKIVLEI